jgi:hypothetical protein
MNDDQDWPEIYTGVLKQQMQQRAMLFKRLVERYGEGVLDVVAQAVIDDTAAKLKNADLPRRDLDGVMEILWDQVADRLDFTVEERSEKRLALRVTRCFFADEMRRLGAAEIGYAFYCTYDDGFCQGLNPAITFTRTRTLMQGNDCCDHTYDLE